MSAEEEPRPSDVPKPIVFRKKKPKSIRQRAAADADEKDRHNENDVKQTTTRTTAAQEESTSTLAALLKAVDGRHAVLGETDDGEEGDKTADAKEKEAPALSELLKQRRKQQHRPKGVEFRVERFSHDGDLGEAARGAENPETSLAPGDTSEAPQDVPVGGLLKRFAPQMGLRTDLVNRHM